MTFEFRLPDIGEGVAEGEVVQWFVREGEMIREDAPLVSVLTDKANVEIPSPKAGTVVKIHAKVGEKVKVGGLLVTIETGSAATSATKPVGESPASIPTATPGVAERKTLTTSAAGKSAPAGSRGAEKLPPGTSPSAPKAATPPSSPVGTGDRILASPFLRRKAAELGVDLSSVRGSGPGGRILESDLHASPSVGEPRAAPTSASALDAEAATEAEVAPRAAGGPDRITKVPIRGLRRAIAEHMALSKRTAAHFTYVEEVDATRLVELRERMAPHVEKAGVRLSYLPFIIKSVVAGLREKPQLNARMDDEHQELLVHSAFHIGIATAAPEGLLVPVIHDADSKTISQLAQEIGRLGERARDAKLSRAELTGSTFTITSLGALGGLLATPILNYPEVGILGVHKIQKRPVVRADGSIAPADLMNLSVSLDHRVLDGIVAAQFLAVVKGCLEDPHRLFADMA
ncbi:MAG: dihydrolipoamide acetyltransferase family protein [Thermoplasmata archaeon]